jgi:hypothetical protein
MRKLCADQMDLYLRVREDLSACRLGNGDLVAAAMDGAFGEVAQASPVRTEEQGLMAEALPDLDCVRPIC